MDIEVIDIKCPICESEKVRSKVKSGDEWWFVCDNQVEHRILLDHEEVVLTERFYFNRFGALKYKGKTYMLEDEDDANRS